MNCNPNANTPTSIRTFGGTYFDFMAPEMSIFTIEDIAHALSHICRFTGHSETFYSVAQHSVLVSQIVPKECALFGLLHDAPEAFIGDVAKPLKNLLPDYAEIEARVERAVFDRLGLVGDIPKCVKVADLIMLRTEQRDIMGCEAEVWAGTAGEMPLQEIIRPVSSREARQMFLDRYYELTEMPSLVFGEKEVREGVQRLTDKARDLGIAFSPCKP